MSTTQIFERMLSKFQRRAPLDASDRKALLELPHETKVVEANRYIAREGDVATRATLMLSGLAFRHKVTVDGARQILSLHIPGDFVDLENSLLQVADHSVQALVRCEVAMFPREAVIDLIDRHPKIGRAMWIDTLIDASIFREWIVNVGRRDARSGMAHLLCEFARRLELADLGDSDGYVLPMTHEQLADALGLTPVHVHRVLKALEADGMIVREARHLRIPNWERLRKEAGFNELYLHLDQIRV